MKSLRGGFAPAGIGVGSALLAVALGRAVATSSGSRTALLALAAVAALAAVLVMRVRPRIALVVAVAAMALPYAWAPNVPSLGRGFGPVIGVLLVLAFFPSVSGYRLSTFDVAVAAFAVTAGPVAWFQGQPFQISLWLAPPIIVTYFGFRLLFSIQEARRLLAPTVVVTGVAVALIGLWGSLSGHNPVAGKVTVVGSSFVTTWNAPSYRDGQLRALATFGHPIALGMFLLIPLAFALSRPGRHYFAATIVILAGEVVTYSRGPWLGALLIVVLMSGWSRRRVALVISAALAAAVFVAPVQRVIVESVQTNTAVGHNASYRFGLLGSALHHLSLLGHPGTDIQAALPNYADLTSLPAITIIQTGIVGVIELAAIAWLALRAFKRAARDGDADEWAAAVALVGSLVGLLSVTLITNYQFFFWMLVAFVATFDTARQEQEAPDKRIRAASSAYSTSSA